MPFIPMPALGSPACFLFSHFNKHRPTRRDVPPTCKPHTPRGTLTPDAARNSRPPATNTTSTPSAAPPLPVPSAGAVGRAVGALPSLSTSSLIENDVSPITSYEHVLDCVLKVFCTHCEPNYELPWTVTPQRISTSSAFVIHGRHILTNAHSVQHHTTVKVKRRDSDTKYTASVVAVGNECDIALLSVEDEKFWRHFESQADANDDADADGDADGHGDGDADVQGDADGYGDADVQGDADGHDGANGLDDVDGDHDDDGTETTTTPQPPYLMPGPLPHLQDSVLVIGYPSPGNQISVTAGVTSRVEMQHYVYGQGDLLTVQIDAAINPGNSGGPVINDRHQVIGIAFQSIDPSQADSVGYFIPYCIVQHFLDDITYHHRYTGFPFAGFRWQRMENPFLRRANGMAEAQTGILVKWVAETSDASRVLSRGDIVTHIDNISVSNAGTVPFRSGERIGLDFLITSKFSHDFVTVTFLRKGGPHTESYQLSSNGDHRLVPVHDSRHPGYIVFGGLVFQILSEPYLRAVYGPNWLLEAPVRLIDEYYRGTRKKTGKKEIVVLTQILATEVTNGYEQEDGNDGVILRSVNGREVCSLRHLNQLLDDCTREVDVRFDLEDDDVIILDKAAAEEEEPVILETHCIPTTRSLGPEER